MALQQLYYTLTFTIAIFRAVNVGRAIKPDEAFDNSLTSKLAQPRLLVTFERNPYRSSTDDHTSSGKTQYNKEVLQDSGNIKLYGLDAERVFDIPGIQVLFVARAMRVAILEVSKRKDVGKLTTEILALRGVESVEQDSRVHALDISRPESLPWTDYMWGMEHIGITASLSEVPFLQGGRNFDSTEATEIVVAVIDSGVDYRHPAIMPTIWNNQNEILDGIDNDGNGYIDDINGYDFVNDDNNPDDDNHHGTLCSGIVATIGNSLRESAGNNYTVSIMALKILDSFGFGYISGAIQALDYALQMNAKISLHAWGGIMNSSFAMSAAIDGAVTANHVFVAAAGNQKQDTDANPQYPGAYSHPTVISVAASTSSSTLSHFSNYGVRSVHLAAPGSMINSTVPGGGHSVFSGTSFAAAHVAGGAALLMLTAAPEEVRAEDIKAVLLETTVPATGLNGRCSSGGILHVGRAVMRMRHTQETSGDAVVVSQEDLPMTDSNTGDKQVRSSSVMDLDNGYCPVPAQALLFDEMAPTIVGMMPALVMGYQGIASAGDSRIPLRQHEESHRFLNIGTLGHPVAANLQLPGGGYPSLHQSGSGDATYTATSHEVAMNRGQQRDAARIWFIGVDSPSGALTKISVTGTTGRQSDNTTAVEYGSLGRSSGGSGWFGWYKKVYNITSAPSLNHLMVAPTSEWGQSVSSNPLSEFDALQAPANGSSAARLYCLIWEGYQNGRAYAYSRTQFRAVFNAFVHNILDASTCAPIIAPKPIGPTPPTLPRQSPLLKSAQPSSARPPPPSAASLPRSTPSLCKEGGCGMAQELCRDRVHIDPAMLSEMTLRPGENYSQQVVVYNDGDIPVHIIARAHAVSSPSTSGFSRDAGIGRRHLHQDGSSWPADFDEEKQDFSRDLYYGLSVDFVEASDDNRTVAPTEVFESNSHFDLMSTKLMYIPHQDGHHYSVCSVSPDLEVFSLAEPSFFSSEYAQVLPLGDDDFFTVQLSPSFNFFGVSYAELHVGSNGYITFGDGDAAHNGMVHNHFSAPRISVLYHDLDPVNGGQVYYEVRIKFPTKIVVDGLNCSHLIPRSRHRSAPATLYAQHAPTMWD
ncbi:hypothetical protein CYMTET_43312 [Cymbomonas tetramitiformis]|uniref:Peptidase S8/S53 domain-containing protein n=1 Tax=Cymbomonas tetramitiformis TaxID=36881 RepID=A0AAE0BY59_9CHLO|nr:hypothetical protein CYMTET_45484 [Cymbomonas tetramitiformis]KAK3247183.1 hypothetical protein CYMTET_43312 [Cymbomonas tetramitiformis]